MLVIIVYPDEIDCTVIDDYSAVTFAEGYVFSKLLATSEDYIVVSAMKT